MNFLAHLYLSGSDEQIMIGNFIADSVKGSSYKDFPQGIAKGILLHRAIDHYSDNHPVFLKSVERLRPNYRKYAGVIVDIYYDHFLAKHWHLYSAKTLKQYSREVYALMLKNSLFMPEKSLLFLKYAMRTNRLVSYATLQGMEEVFYGMSRRASFESKMEMAVVDLKNSNALFEEEFREFFEEIKNFVKQWNEGNNRFEFRR